MRATLLYLAIGLAWGTANLLCVGLDRRNPLHAPMMSVPRREARWMLLGALAVVPLWPLSVVVSVAIVAHALAQRVRGG